MLRGWLTGQIMPVYERRALPMTASIAQICAGLHIPDPKSERDVWLAATAMDAGVREGWISTHSWTLCRYLSIAEHSSSLLT